MKNRSLLILILLGCGIFAVLAIGFCAGFLYLSFSNTEDAISPRIDAMFLAIENNTFGETYLTETAPELRKGASKEQYEQMGDAIRTRLGSLTSKKMVRCNVRQFNNVSYADVVYSATFEKGTGTITARLTRSGRKWLFVTFRVNSPEFLKDLATAVCVECGEAHAATDRFCPACGAAITDSTDDEPNASKKEDQGPSGNRD